MAQAKKGKATQNATVATKQAELVGGAEITYADIWAFVNTQAGGNLHNVAVVPLDNVQLDQAQPVPFGYGGRAGGVRQQIQDWLLFGVDGNDGLFMRFNDECKQGLVSRKNSSLE